MNLTLRPSQWSLAFLLPLFFLFFTQQISAQSNERVSIEGQVGSPTGETLPGVHVTLTDTDKGAITDIEGNFRISGILPGSYQLKVSALGFKTYLREIKISAETPKAFNITLEPESYLIDDIYVNAKSATRRVIEQAYQVSSVSAQNLANSTSDAKSVLNRVPGVRIQQEGGLGSDYKFSLNGFSGDQVKFFLDGIPIANSGSMQLGDLPVNMVERIDVYKGVVPVWLGTDALGGAVNIVTNRLHNYADISYSVGSFNTHRASLNGAYTNPESGFTLRGNLFLNYSDNDYDVWARIVENNTVVDTAWVPRFHDRYRSGAVKLETGLVNKPYADNLLLGFSLTANDKQVQHGATMNTVYGGVMRENSSITPTLRYSKKNLFTEGLDVSLYSALNLNTSQVVDTLSGVRYNWLGEKTTVRTADGSVSTDGEFYRTNTTLDEEQFDTQLNAGYALNTRSSLALNYSFNYFHRKAHDKENPNNVDNRFPKSQTKQVLGLAYKFDISNKWSTTVFGKWFHIRAETSKEVDFGLETRRTEAVENSQHNFGYGLASTYFLVPQLQLKLSYERTARMPIPEEIFGDGLFVQANPDLGPEKSHNLNLGSEYRLNFNNQHMLALGASLIYREAEDLIYTVVTVSSPQTRYENLSKTRVMGVEASLQYQWKDMFKLGGNFTYQDITDQAKRVYNDSFTGTGWQTNYHYGYRLPNRPYLFGNMNAGLTFSDFLANRSDLNLNYFVNFVERYSLTWTELGAGNSRYIIPRQVSHDIELGYSFDGGTYNLSAECRNLFNSKLYDQYYLQKPGRSFSIKLRYNI
ncbi:TonB-dependent receptor [Gracilimonas mengyeensis]|uniref:Outer membrane receptor proteins, mostly Fe transport n=1 Tax=Gracilimonas mengyeensis TaxID=1302730 RepID=A0A521ES82_9BACT|nr:TonB-dependent receptor [Gracilimonas mengyeensis]SMO86803.1 Outer membrane receptor proteins, mostly Fe transport [Gracilimonas mengyeensis]